MQTNHSVAHTAMDHLTECDLPAGRIRFCRKAGLIYATGIPYARAGRWQLPQAFPSGPVNALMWAKGCPQLPVARLDAALPDAFDRIRFDEACLELSVTAPENADGLPVMVWLHGGSYESGAGDMAVFDPSVLVTEQRIVVVSVTYRLGLFGWLSGDGRPANLGAWDVIAALKWVAGNIAHLGGDPGQVTLFGQSSGGDLVARLMVVDETRGLFHRAIVQSAPLALQLGSSGMRRVMRRVARGLDRHHATTMELLTCQARIRRAVRRYGLAGQMPFGIEFGAAPFPSEEGLDAAYRKSAPHIPVLIGHLRDEAALFIPPVSQSILQLFEPARRRIVKYLTGRLYAGPARLFARRHAAAGGKVMRYVIDWGRGAYGAAHLAELALLFPAQDWIGSPLVPAGISPEELIRAGKPLRRLWAGFARGESVAENVPGIIRFLHDG